MSEKQRIYLKILSNFILLARGPYRTRVSRILTGIKSSLRDRGLLQYELLDMIIDLPKLSLYPEFRDSDIRWFNSVLLRYIELDLPYHPYRDELQNMAIALYEMMPEEQRSKINNDFRN